MPHSGLPTWLGINLTRSAPTIRTSSVPPHPVALELIRYNPHWFILCVNILTRYETLPKLANACDPYALCNPLDHHFGAKYFHCLISRLRVNSHTPKAFSVPDLSELFGQKSNPNSCKPGLNLTNLFICHHILLNSRF